MNEKMGFVVLHYYTIEDTIKCIESIIANITTNNYEIVIVDNNSLNNTGKKLQDIYKKNKKIHVILNDKNLGFSKGNNIGYKYAKNVLNCQYIIMMNNDTCIVGNNWISKISEEYKEKQFAVMGPKIILKNNKINPVRKGEIPTKSQVRKTIIANKIKYILAFLKLETLYNKFSDKLSKKREERSKHVDTDKRQENVILHGCCWIFSPIYVNKFDGIEDRTFLYCEEEFLYLRIIEHNLKIVYQPDIVIFHAEDGATNAITNKKRDKKLFYYKNLIKSEKVLYKKLKKIR